MPTVMIVDDEKLSRTHIRTILEKEGYNIICEAEDGDEAVELFRLHRPNIVLMDYVMKRMDGIQASKEIKKIEPSVKIVILTQSAKPSVVMGSIRAGASNFIMKPCEPNQLLNIVRKFSEYY